MYSLRIDVLLLSAALGALGSACGGFDSGNPLRTRPATVADGTEPGAEEDDDDGALEPDAGETEGGATPAPGEDGGTAAPRGAFEGAAAYASTLGASARKAGHNFAGATPVTNPAGRPCFNCHGTAGGPRAFAFAGTVYKDAAGTQPAPRVEVRVLDANGKALSTFTDADGNFFLPRAGNAVAFPARSGTRDADTTRLMVAGLAEGNCNGCHRPAGAAKARLVVP